MKIGRNYKQSGAALITAIAFTAIFSTIVGGIALYTVGTYSLAKKGTEYAAAIQLADAGTNYELRNISRNQFATGFVPPTASTPDTGSVSGINGTFSAYVTSDAAGTQNWDPTKQDLYIWSTGTVNGVARRVTAHGIGGVGLLNQYTVYGANSITFSGSGSEVIGSIGTNGTVTSPSSGSGAVTGEIYLNGPSAGGVTGSNVTSSPDPVLFPTVDQILSATFSAQSDPESYISTHNNNANMRSFVNKTSSTLSPSNTQTVGSFPHPNKLLDPDLVQLNQNTIILPATNAPAPTDYYFTDISLNGGNYVIVDNGGLTTGKGPGLVRVWMFQDGNTSNDIVSQPIAYTATPPAVPDPAQLFRLYYDKNANFQLDGDTVSGGAFYGINEYPSSTFKITGNSYTYGAVLANNINISGNSTVSFPGGLPGNGTDIYSLWFGFKDGYQELPFMQGRVTFPDGTSN